ncbi:MAG: hypothetical protein BVN35_02085 [Proteobacteria bacterium ST_bin11]|nr:MAG: hypothetical protein BVN35_02085 [Proteobacteria bacterium ST_bin11]
MHLVHYSLNYVGRKMRKQIAAELKQIYQLAPWQRLSGNWQRSRRNGTAITLLLPRYGGVIGIASSRFSTIRQKREIRRIFYTTNAIESVNMSLRKITKNRGSFPNDEALSKLFYLTLMNINKKWIMAKRCLNLRHFRIVH